MEDKLEEIFSCLFEIDTLEDDMSPETVKNWDSLAHLTLVEELENAFDVKFSLDEIIEMLNVRAIKEILGEHGIS